MLAVLQERALIDESKLAGQGIGLAAKVKPSAGRHPQIQ